MRYEVISADCHVDLCWLPPGLFTENASAAMRSRMPYVGDGPNGRQWMTRSGANLGLVNGMGSAGRKYIPGKIHRSDRMAATGLYDDGKRGIRRLTDPDLRIKDQDRDGVQAEVLYGVLGATSRLNDAEAAVDPAPSLAQQGRVGEGCSWIPLRRVRAASIRPLRDNAAAPFAARRP